MIHIIGLAIIEKALRDQSSIIGLSFNCKEENIIGIIFVDAFWEGFLIETGEATAE